QSLQQYQQMSLVQEWIRNKQVLDCIRVKEQLLSYDLFLYVSDHSHGQPLKEVNHLLEQVAKYLLAGHQNAPKLARILPGRADDHSLHQNQLNLKSINQ